MIPPRNDYSVILAWVQMTPLNIIVQIPRLFNAQLTLFGTWRAQRRSSNNSRTRGGASIRRPLALSKFTKLLRSRSTLSFGTGSPWLRLLHGNRTSHAHNLDVCKGVAAQRENATTKLLQGRPLHGFMHANHL